MRARFAKDHEAAGLTPQAFCEAVQSAADATALPLERGKGARPRPRITPGPPLPVGYVSRCEYIDFELAGPVTAEELSRQLAPRLPRGIRLLWQRRLPGHAPHLRAAVTGYTYCVTGAFAAARAALFGRAATWPYRRVRGERMREGDLKDSVARLVTGPEHVEIDIVVRPDGTPKPAEVIEAVFGLPAEEGALLPAERIAVHLALRGRPRKLYLECT